MTLITIGSLDLRFLQTKVQTGGSIDVFEMTLHPGGRMPVPHYHETWDETVYGLDGTTTFTVDGARVDLRPGDSVFIKRGVVHGFDNDSGALAKCLCILTPGTLGPRYFQELAELAADGEPDLDKVRATMRRYGLVPVLASGG